MSLVYPPGMLRDAAPLPGYPEPYGLLCAILQDGTNEWRMELGDDVSEDAMVWQPYPGAHSIGTIILHIIMVEVYWFEKFVLDLPLDPEEVKLTLWEETDVDEGVWPEPPRKPISWYFEFQDRVRARILESIKKWPPAEATKKGREDEISARWVFGHVIQHESYHGGQAVLLHELWKKKAALSTQ